MYQYKPIFSYSYDSTKQPGPIVVTSLCHRQSQGLQNVAILAWRPWPGESHFSNETWRSVQDLYMVISCISRVIRLDSQVSPKRVWKDSSWMVKATWSCHPCFTRWSQLPEWLSGSTTDPCWNHFSLFRPFSIIINNFHSLLWSQNRSMFDRSFGPKKTQSKNC